jgi:predicted peptidase
MRFAAAVSLGLLVFQTNAGADTGFLDRSVTIGQVTYRYQVYVPADYSNVKVWPVVVDLHGNDAQGSDGLLPTVGGLANQIRRNRSRFPAIVIVPQAEVGKRWGYGDMEDLVIAELDRTMSEFRCDPARIYLTGFSMGASGAYRIAYRWPNRFAAIVAVAGRIDTSDAKTYSDRDRQVDREANPFVKAADPFADLAARIKHLPIRIFHGDADETVPVDQSRRLVPALKAAGADVGYEEYHAVTHVGAVEKAFADEKLIEWLFAQHR